MATLGRINRSVDVNGGFVSEDDPPQQQVMALVETKRYVEFGLGSHFAIDFQLWLQGKFMHAGNEMLAFGSVRAEHVVDVA